MEIILLLALIQSTFLGKLNYIKLFMNKSLLLKLISFLIDILNFKIL